MYKYSIFHLCQLRCPVKSILCSFAIELKETACCHEQTEERKTDFFKDSIKQGKWLLTIIVTWETCKTKVCLTCYQTMATSSQSANAALAAFIFVNYLECYRDNLLQALGELFPTSRQTGGISNGPETHSLTIFMVSSGKK